MHSIPNNLFCSLFKDFNLEILPDEDVASNTVTSIKLPKNIDGVKFLSEVKKQFNVILGGGQKSLTGKIFRVGHMGWVEKEEIDEALIASKKISSIEEFAIIVELKHYKKSKFGVHLPVALAKTLKVLFPNCLHKCYLRNSPMVFRCVFRLIYPLLDKDTRKKIFFIKGNKEIPCTEYSLDDV